MDRRHFLKHLTAVSAWNVLSIHVPRWCAWAQSEDPRPHFYMFIFASGGWDPTMVFETKEGLSTIDVDPAASVVQSGGIRYFHNPQRPWVKTFFDDFSDRVCVINGVDTQSISHEVGTEIMMTGDAGTPSPDWPTIISYNNGADLVLPHMALSGPSYSAGLGVGTSSGSGFLSLLIFNGEAFPPNATAEAELTGYTERYFNRLMDGFEAQGRTGSRLPESREAFRRWKELKAIKEDLGDEFRTIEGLAGEGIALASAFERGFAITGTIEARGNWDSHSNNFPAQNESFNNTFQGLHAIVTHLTGRPATSGPGTLLDQTTLIVMSEMGRTPKLNASQGKDHWPITTVMAIGGSVRGNRILGATDDLQNAEPVDFSSGEVAPEGGIITSMNIGAALLELAGIDPTLYLPSDTRPFEAFLEGV